VRKIEEVKRDRDQDQSPLRGGTKKVVASLENRDTGGCGEKGLSPDRRRAAEERKQERSFLSKKTEGKAWRSREKDRPPEGNGGECSEAAGVSGGVLLIKRKNGLPSKRDG